MARTTVLIAGVDKHNLEYLARSLQSAGHVVATNVPSRAASAARSMGPDAVVLDASGVAAPDALALVREIRAASEAVLVVVVPAHDRHSGAAALDAGADDFLLRPFAVAELQARLRARLRTH